VRATDLVTGAGAATAQKHAYSSEISNDKAGRSAKHMKRIHKELKNMKKHLPVSEGASIFIRFDKNKPYVMRALVSGPVDTPFESGLFVFDIFCPPTYPKVPPKVKLMTTGKGTVRFSPNLYREGKVCLSLLGTWKGPGWDPKKSSILQVLVSIQSLVFVERPHEMEPGFGGWGEEATQISSIRGACKGADKAKNGTCTLEMMVQQLKSHDQTDNWGGSDPEGTIQSFVMASGCVDSASDEDETPLSTGSGESKTTASASTTAAKDDKHKLVRYEKFLDEHFLDIESTRYNARIHGACLQWAINDMVENSARMYPEFVEVVGTHFAQKKESIAKTLRAWERKDRILPKRHALLVKEIAKFASTMKVDVTTKVEKIVEAAEAKSAEGGASEKDQGTDPKEPSGQALEAPELIDFHLFEIEPGSEVVF
jgi:ubiquitin-protein ligase